MIDLEQAFGAILGLIVGGGVFLTAGAILDASFGLNLMSWGVFYILVATLLAITLVIAGVHSVVNQA